MGRTARAVEKHATVCTSGRPEHRAVASESDQQPFDFQLAPELRGHFGWFAGARGKFTGQKLFDVEHTDSAI